MAVSVTQEDALTTCVARYINLGFEDPVEIAKHVRSELGDEVLSEAFLDVADGFLRELARRLLRNRSSQAENNLEENDVVGSSNVLLAKTWIPGVGWKKNALLTRPDLLARAAWYDRLAALNTRRAEWCRECADLLKREGAETLGDLTVPLPALPKVEE